MERVIRMLRDISDRCLADLPLTEDHGHWLGAALERFLNEPGTPIGEALGLRFARGGVPWWKEEAIRKRDAVLRELVERFFGEFTPARQAHEIATMANRYAASAWRHDREHGDMPRHYAGTRKESLWQAFASGAPMPIGERQLRHILGR